MDFTLSEEQTLFRDSVERTVADLFPFARRREATETEEGYREDDWRRLAELGCMAAPFPESCGGLGGGPEETMLVAESFGRHLANLPFLASAVLGGHAVLFGGTRAQREAILPGVADGSLKLALACGERQARFDLAPVATEARAAGDGYVISGRKDVVLYGQAADRLVVSARLADGPAGGGTGLFVVPADAGGVARSPYPTHDGGRACNVLLDDVRVGLDALLGAPGDGLDALERAVDHGIAFLCADAAGSMRRVYETTLEYLKTRRQFGRTLGSFQALQHRMVDVYVSCELARSMAFEATLNLCADAAARRRAVSAAKASIGEAARRVCEEGVQLHGGVGMTMDMPVGHHLKRAMAMNAAFGDARHHLARYAGLDRAARLRT